jgi:hypothetical protein
VKNNPFAWHGIEHLSPSSLNCWRAAPGIWTLRYLARIKDDGNAAMWRGSAVENGLAAFLRGTDIESAISVAHQAFSLNCQGTLTDENALEHSLIAPMMRQCETWKPPADLNATQLRVEYSFEAIPVPIIGYLDFAFDGIDVDLKTTKAIPSTPRPDHVRQVALYRAARNRSGGLLYVSAKRAAYYQVDDDAMDRALNDLHSDALSLMSFLSHFDNARDAVRALPMDRSSYLFPTKPIPADLLMAG